MERQHTTARIARALYFSLLLLESRHGGRLYFYYYVTSSGHSLDFAYAFLLFWFIGFFPERRKIDFLRR
jgi:hypothetical protein